MQDPSDLKPLTIAEAAAFLRLSERKLYTLVQDRRLPFVRIDGRLLFLRRLLEIWLIERAEGAVPHDAPPILAGSHDPLLEWAAHQSGCGLAILPVGSVDGLAKLAAGQAAAAGVHIREAHGRYNVAAVRDLGLPDLVLLHWAVRRQGLVSRSDDRPCATIAEAAATGCRFARRQPGAGAQILLEHLLAEAGVDPATVRWADGVCRTHHDVVAAVQDGVADVGIAISAVARRAGLLFAPAMEERFDLAMRRRIAFEPAMQRLLGFARTAEFRRHAEAQGDYDVGGTGEVAFNA